MRIRVLATTLFLLTAAVYGQSRYDVPFAFQVGDNHFAAGWYTVSTSPISGQMLMVSRNGGGAIFIMPQGRIEAAAPPAGKLVFRCYGTACFLSQVWRGGDRVGSQLRQSKAEREVASRNTNPTLVYAAVK